LLPEKRRIQNEEEYKFKALSFYSLLSNFLSNQTQIFISGMENFLSSQIKN
jgi:hypothetical protein